VLAGFSNQKFLLSRDHHLRAMRYKDSYGLAPANVATAVRMLSIAAASVILATSFACADTTADQRTEQELINIGRELARASLNLDPVPYDR